MTTEQQPQTIPLPENFPVHWESPEEAAGFWTADLMHWPHGLSPLSATMDMPAFGRGLAQAGEELRMPFRGVGFKHVNGYVYTSFQPWSYDPAEMEPRMQEMRGAMTKHIPGLLDRWYGEYEPEVRSLNDETLHGNYAQLGDRDLAALLDKIVQKREREGLLHFLAVFPAMGAVMGYEEMYAELFGAPRAGEHLQLLQGFPNKSVEVGDALWRLATEARKRPQVMRVLQAVPAEQAHAALSEAEQGSAFRGAVEEFLDRYGWRANELDVAEPTWKEQPAPVYNLVREYAARDDYDPEEEFKSLVVARRAREDAMRRKVSGNQLQMFDFMLSAAQQYLPVQEDHNFWIDQQGVCVQRVPVLEAGRRLQAAGCIGSVPDVFFLHYEELQEALRDGKGRLQEIVERRRREREEFRGITPPPAIGTPPPPEAQEDPMVGKFFGAQPEQHPDPRVLNGNAASAGKVTATARVILTLDEAHRLGRGEVLVCPATMPPWTPLFAIASAVVTDHGGILSHTAIVAREYRIPAVVGAKVATAIIQDGQRITVDGTAGTVKLEG